MKTIVIGQGAIGLLWYHSLSEIGHDVELMCSSRVKQIPEVMEFTDIKGQTTQSIITPASMHSLTNASIVLLCLKAYQVEAALVQYMPAISKDAAIILCHNGMLSTEKVIPLVKSHRLFQLLTSHGCLKNNNFSITHTGLGQSQLGHIYSPQLSKVGIKENTLQKLLDKALPTVTQHNDITQLQWLKLAVNCVINPITALNDIDNGEIAKAQYQQQVRDLCNEIALVAARQQVLLHPKSLVALVYQVAENTAKNCSSMRADLLNKRKTENEYINGFIHRLSIEHHLRCPTNAHLYQQIVEQEQLLGITGDKP